MKIRYPIAMGVVCGLLGMAFSLTGYGVPLYYMRLLILGAFAVLAFPALFRKKVVQYFLHVALITVIATGLWYAGTTVRRIKKSIVCHELNTLIKQAQIFREKNGQYPEQLDELDFSTRLRLNSKTVMESGIDLEGMNEHDATVYMSTNSFACVVPVTKVLPMSFTRFYVYMWTSDDPEWRYIKVIQMFRKI